MSTPYESGDAILVRSVYRGRVRWALPHRFVGVDEGRLVLYRAPGARGKWMGRDADGRYLERWVGDDEPCDLVWSHTHVLQFVRPADAHTVEVFWDESWALLGWYVNLQDPLRSTALGYDTTDWALDICVTPNGEWSWKDEDDFAEAISLGVFDDVSAAAVWAEGDRVIAAHPWPTGWEDWRPPESWDPLPLPEGWAERGSSPHEGVFSIRRAVASDGMILKDVRLRALRADPASFTEVLADVEDDPDDEWEQWAADVSRIDGDSAVLLAFGAESTTAVGMAGGFLRGEPYDDARVFGVWLDSDARGSGIARCLVEEVIAWAKSTGRERLTLCVMETSVAAIALYRALGFEEEGCAAPSCVHEGATELAMVLRLREG